MVVFKFIVLRLHPTISLGVNNILPCLPLCGSTYHITFYMEATTDQLSGFPAPWEGIDVQRIDRNYGSHAVAAIFMPIVHKTLLKWAACVQMH